MIVLALTFAIFLFLDAASDWYRIEKKKVFIKHGYDAFIAWCFYWLAAGWGIVLGLNPSVMVAAIVLVPGVRWIVHDLLLNWFRGLPWDYFGKEVYSAKTDKLLMWGMDRGVGPFGLKLIALLVNIIAAIGAASLTNYLT